jgi:hypothetical protein
MDVNEQDRLIPTESGRRRNSWLLGSIVLITIVLALVIIGYIYKPEIFNSSNPTIDSAPAPAITGEMPQVEEAPVPVIPQARTPSPLPPIPTLENSDDFLRQHWLQLKLPAATKSWLQHDFLIQRVVSFINGLANGQLLTKYLPLNTSPFLLPRGAFQSRLVDGQLSLGDANFTRYARPVEFLTTLDGKNLAEIFHWLRPLLDSAYKRTGQGGGDFGVRLITAIDLMLATPEANSPLELKRESVIYKFADPQLERLANSQKLLLRMGPKNRTLVQKWLRELRVELLAADD